MSSLRSFVELFSPAPAPAAPTEKPPIERLAVLRTALDSGEWKRQKIALEACDTALQTDNFVRIGGGGYRGLRSSPRLWYPSGPDEILEYYRQAWEVLRSRVNAFPSDLQSRAVRILLGRAREVAGLGLSEMVVDTLRELAGLPSVDRRQVIQVAEEALYYDSRHLTDPIVAQWQDLRDELVGEDFSSLLRRYVGMDLLEDRYDLEGKEIDRARPVIEHLAACAMTRPELLEHELEWLLTSGAPNGLRLGYELGKRDIDQTILPMLLTAQRRLAPSANGVLLGGYLRAISESNLDRMEDLLDTLAGESRLSYLVPELTWHTRLTERAGRRLVELVRRQMVPLDTFGMFSTGGVVHSLSEEVLAEWLELLHASGGQAQLADAVQLLFYYYVFDREDAPLPKELTLRILSHESLFHSVEGARLDSLVGHTWSDTAQRLIRQNPDCGMTLARVLLGRLGEKGVGGEDVNMPVFAVLAQVLHQDSEGLWQHIAPLLGPPVDKRAYRLAQWLHGNDRPQSKGGGAIQHVPKLAVWRWVDADIENRAWYIASLVPNDLTTASREESWQRAALVRYGEREDVRRNIGRNFTVSVWWGPESEHWSEIRDALLRIRDGEANANVLRWIDEETLLLESRIEQARTEEERHC